MVKLIAKYKRMLLRECVLLVFTTLVCLGIYCFRHAKVMDPGAQALGTVNTNFGNQL